MAIYIDRNEAGDVENLSQSVLAYCIKQHTIQEGRLLALKQAYLARNVRKTTADDEIAVVAAYPRYIVETLKGYYLGDPIKYTLEDDDDSDKLIPGQRAYIDMYGGVRKIGNDNVVKEEADKPVPKFRLKPDDDIKPLLDAYNHQTISDIDNEIGKNIGIYGESYELIYANEESRPMSCVCDPITSFMVRDTSVDHKRLFFVRYDKRRTISDVDYYIAYIYTDKTESIYRTTSLTSWDFVKVDQVPHYFGEVPAVEYQNNSDRLGDFETQMTLINAYNFLISDRCTDKAKFIKSVLAMYGTDLSDEMIQGLKDYGILAGLPIDSRLEYIQKQLDEGGAHILAQDIAREIHKQSMTVDMTDELFSGNSSGQALKLKLLTMTMLVKNKMRALEKGLKKRFEIYNAYLQVQGTMAYVDKDSVTPIFTISLPIDELTIVQIVRELQGIVDQETLLGLLWFVKDPAKTIEKVNEEKAQNQERFLDTFGISANRRENVGGDADDEDDTAESGEDRKPVFSEE